MILGRFPMKMVPSPTYKLKLSKLNFRDDFLMVLFSFLTGFERLITSPAVVTPSPVVQSDHECGRTARRLPERREPSDPERPVVCSVWQAAAAGHGPRAGAPSVESGESGPAVMIGGYFVFPNRNWGAHSPMLADSSPHEHWN